ncbi:eight-cysteine-cluster domain-containing protein [Archaeoglobus neptunius]|uniref:eight-cysteine-cluster domain-containing protein n=1 Tax=Archaeoglobus neptunius TaxID=2798580 RepID=UPI0019288A97|nr:eight-cysteine-cluster domain-containing protein [Archaeoglobus neptunius]
MRKMFLAGLVALCVAAVFIAVRTWEAPGVEYQVLGCEGSKMQQYSGFEVVDGDLKAYIMRNCCSDKITVEKDGKTYRIVEIDEDGKICKCNCMAVVEIKNVEKDARVVFVDFTGERKVLKNLENEFCGWSTYAECKSDADCTVGGCSGQVCMGSGEDIVTTCDWKDCYDAKKFGMTCGCFEGQCQWAQS